MKTSFKKYSIKKSTVIILDIEQFRYTIGEKGIKILKPFREKIKELNDRYNEYFYLPIDEVRFCTEVGIKGKNFGLAKKIAQELYDFLKSYNDKLIVKVCIGYGDIGYMPDRLHHSNGPVFWRVGREVDDMKTDGIVMIEGEWTEENMKNDKLKKRLHKLSLSEDTIEKTIDYIEKYKETPSKRTYHKLTKFMDNVIHNELTDEYEIEKFMDIIWVDTELEYVGDPDENLPD